MVKTRKERHFSQACRRFCLSWVLWETILGFLGSEEPTRDRSVTPRTPKRQDRRIIPVNHELPLGSINFGSYAS